jgi:hypothetical protein
MLKNPDIPGLEAAFRLTLKNSRILGPTTFVMEEFIPDVSVDRSVFEAKANFSTDKIWSLAPNGGALVIAHRADYDTEGNYFRCLSIYDGPGNFIGKIDLTIKSTIKAVLVTPSECIVIVYVDGYVVSYNLRGDQLRLYDFCAKKCDKEPPDDSPDEEFRNFRVILCAFWSHGFFLVTVSGDVYVCRDLADLTPEKFCTYKGPMLLGGFAVGANPSRQEGPKLWAWSSNSLVLLQRVLKRRRREAIFSPNCAKVPAPTDPAEDPWTTKTTTYSDFPFPISQISFSPSQQYFVVRAETRYHFFDADSHQVVLNYEFDDMRPDYVVWCGNDTIVLICRSKVAMIGAYDSVISWTLDSSCAAVSEADGVRLVTQSGVRLLRAIPEAPLQFALWNQKYPSVQLFTRILDPKYVARRDPEREFSSLDDLEVAVEGLKDAADFFTRTDQRSALMLAITRTMVHVDTRGPGGMANPEIRNFDSFAGSLAEMRVCERLAHDPYNMVMTTIQMRDLSTAVLLKRLCNRSLHLHAYQIADFCRVDTDFIAAHWANCLVRAEDDAGYVLERLKAMAADPTIGGIDFIDLASTAFEVDRPETAAKLLEHNEAKLRGVPLLIAQARWEEALGYATRSADTSLMLWTLHRAKEAEEDEKMKKLFAENRLAREMWGRYTTGEDRLAVLRLAGREGDDLLRTFVVYESQEAEDELKLSLKEHKDQFLANTYEMYKGLIPIKKWLRDKKEGVPDLPPPEVGILDRLLKKTPEEETPAEEAPAAKPAAPIVGLFGRLVRGEDDSKGKGKKGKSRDSDDDSDDRPRKKKKKRWVSDSDSDSDSKSRGRRRKKKGNRDDSSDEEDTRRSKRGKKRDDSDEEPSTARKKGTKGDADEPSVSKKGTKGDADEPSVSKKGKKDDDGEEPSVSSKKDKKGRAADEPEAPPPDKPEEPAAAEAPKPEETPAQPAEGEAPPAGGLPPPAPEEDEKGKPPHNDLYDAMTPLELFEQVILTGDPAKIKIMVSILRLGKEEAIWKRLLTGLKYNNMEVLKLICKDVRASDMMPYKEYCRQKQNERASAYLAGRDPDAEEEEKKTKKAKAAAHNK